MSKTFSSFSFGCRVNQAEKEQIDRQLGECGYTWDERSPEFYIVNTCSVTHKAEREAKQHIYQARKRYPNTKIVVTGCAVTNWLKSKETLPEADLLIDNAQKDYLISIMFKRFKKRKGTHQQASLQPIRDKFLDSKRVIVKIQDGCQRYCTFCIVPYLRGMPKSRSIESVVRSIQGWNGTMQEVILTAINTQAFGYDTKERFVDLVRETLEKTAIPRLSFGSIHPWSIDEDFFKLYESYKNNDRFVDFFHIPLQSGSDKMLKLMKRGYTRIEFTDKLNRIAKMNPFAFIGTDVIVGFLEESDKDFADTYEFLEKTPISKFHVFRFSPRENTAANYLRTRLWEPESSTKVERAKALAELSKKKYQLFMNKHVGKRMKALVLEKTKNGNRAALLQNQVPVLLNCDTVNVGEIRSVEIDGLKQGELFAHLI